MEATTTTINTLIATVVIVMSGNADKIVANVEIPVEIMDGVILEAPTVDPAILGGAIAILDGAIAILDVGIILDVAIIIQDKLQAMLIVVLATVAIIRAKISALNAAATTTTTTITTIIRGAVGQVITLIMDIEIQILVDARGLTLKKQQKVLPYLAPHTQRKLERELLSSNK